MSPQKIKHPDELAKQLIARAQERAENPGKIWGLSWGADMPKLDQITGGIGEKQLVVLISRPNTGKSALAAKWALNVARADRRVRIATYEMSAASYQHRISSFLSGVPIWRIDTGRATADELSRYASAQGVLAGLDIEYQESADTFEEMADFFSGFGGCDLGIIDHIGIVPGFYGQGGYSNAAQTSTRIARLAHNASSLIVLGHQNRASLQSEDKRPTPESVAGSDQITRDADLILGLYRPDQFTRLAEEQANDPKPGELLVLKNRHGPANRVIHLLYSPVHTDWKENPAYTEQERKGKGA